MYSVHVKTAVAHRSAVSHWLLLVDFDRPFLADSGLLRPGNSGQLLLDRHDDFSAHARNFEELKKIKIYLTRSSTPKTVPFALPLSGSSPNSESQEDAKYIQLFVEWKSAANQP